MCNLPLLNALTHKFKQNGNSAPVKHVETHREASHSESPNKLMDQLPGLKCREVHSRLLNSRKKKNNTQHPKTAWANKESAVKNNWHVKASAL